MLAELKGELTAVKEFRKFTAWYTKGIRGAASLRRKTNDIVGMKELADTIRRELNVG